MSALRCGSLAYLLTACGLALAQAPIPIEQPVPAPLLLSAPQFPQPSQIPAPIARSAARAAAPAAAGLAINTQDREAVRLFYQGLFGQSDGVAMNWTGNYATGAAGSTDPLYQNAVALRINWHRAMAGIPADVSLYAPYSQKDQQAALMMSANNALSHTPPSSWKYYTAEGAEAAKNSNLALGNVGPNAVSAGYMKDSGSNNSAVGHRRWILYPQTRSMGTGDVPGGTLNGASLNSANALWVFDSNVNGARPTVRDTFVAWPPKGFVPYPVVYGRWSFSYPQADFSQASVAVRKNGSAVAVTTEPVQNGYGENTLVWLLQGYTNAATWSRPSNDDTYAVTINNVRLNGSAQSFAYDVIVFDPATATPGAARTTVNVPASGAAAAQPFNVSVNPMTGATGYQIGSYSQSALPASLTPANSASAWTYSTSGYNPLESSWFHLYHPSYGTQTLTLGKRLLAGQNAQLGFDRSFGYTLSSESASVQLSLDDGMSWQNIYSEAGQNAPLDQTSKTVDLSAFAGKPFQLRFVFETSGSYYTCTTCGWYFGNLRLSNTTELTSQGTANFTGSQTSGTMTLPAAGSYALFARTQYQNMYFGDWGPMASLTLATASQSAPVCSLSASPVVIAVGGFATLSANCTPAATSYTWTNTNTNTNSGFGSTTASGTVSPTAPTLYSVTGSNAVGSGNTASAAVYVCNTPPTQNYSPLVLGGTSANDQLASGIANDSLDGAAGLDTVLYNCNRSSFTVSKDPNTGVWTLSSSAEGLDTLNNVERVRFGDETLALDISGNAGQAYRLYQAAFNRVPDNGGLKYWIGQLDAGMPLQEVAARFIDSNEFRSLYGTNPSNADFLTQLYNNVLHRAPDPGGYAWWLEQLNTGAHTQKSALMGFSESPENQAGVLNAIMNGIDLLN
ncbi:MAG: DUF4214 domain-containing protein [Rhodoferax sp.]|nr:DUF4214 domain-containing protein [Rhodoferax sp.]